MFPSAPPLVKSRHPLLGLRLCFPIMPAMPAGWFKQAVFFFSLSIIPCPAAAPYTLHTRDETRATRVGGIDLILAFNGCFGIPAYWYCHCFIIILFFNSCCCMSFVLRTQTGANGKNVDMENGRKRLKLFNVTCQTVKKHA